MSTAAEGTSTSIPALFMINYNGKNSKLFDFQNYY